MEEIKDGLKLQVESQEAAGKSLVPSEVEVTRGWGSGHPIRIIILYQGLYVTVSSDQSS